MDTMIVRLKFIFLIICIFRYLHLQDNMDPAVDKTDKLWKLRRFMDLVLVRFQALYETNGFVTVDESMVKYKGRLGFRQYLPMKVLLPFTHYGVVQYKGCAI